MVDLSALAYAARQALVAQGTQLSLSHAQQLVAAALGHGTLAAYQASTDAEHLAAGHVVVDSARLRYRAEALGHAGDAVTAAIVEVLEAALPGPVHEHTEAFVDWLQDFMVSVTLDDAQVESETAMFNHEGVSEVSIPLELPDDLDTGDEGYIRVEIDGQVTMKQGEDQPDTGLSVQVMARLTVQRLGARLFGDPDLDIYFAQSWLGTDEYRPDQPDGEPQELNAKGLGQ